MATKYFNDSPLLLLLLQPLLFRVCYTLLSNGGLVNDNGWALFTRFVLVRVVAVVVPFRLSDDVAAAACLICSKVALPSAIGSSWWTKKEETNKRSHTNTNETLLELADIFGAFHNFWNVLFIFYMFLQIKCKKINVRILNWNSKSIVVALLSSRW